MTCLSVINFCISLSFLIKNGGMRETKIGNISLELIITTVSPALSTCLGVDVSYILSLSEENYYLY